jgi:hypothetical protein
MTTGSVEPLKKLHARYGDRVQFVDVFVRQDHPGERRDTYANYGDKLAGAREYARLEALPWPVLVDDYAGTVHREWGREMADPTILVDADGHVAFAAMWTHVPTLKRAIDALLAQDGRGVVLGGIDRLPHGLAALADGYRGPRRGGIRGVVELDLSGAGAGMLCRLGNLAKPLLAPIALRAAPWGQPDLGAPE